MLPSYPSFNENSLSSDEERWKKRRQRDISLLKRISQDTDEGSDENSDAEPLRCTNYVPNVKRHREKSGIWDEEQQCWVQRDPRQSHWYMEYVESDKYSSNIKLRKKFRRRFRLPRNAFIDLVDLARSNNWFPRYGRKDATGRVGVPLELLILGALRFNDCM
jgi:hypothetical protein